MSYTTVNRVANKAETPVRIITILPKREPVPPVACMWIKAMAICSRQARNRQAMEKASAESHGLGIKGTIDVQ